MLWTNETAQPSKALCFMPTMYITDTTGTGGTKVKSHCGQTPIYAMQSRKKDKIDKLTHKLIKTKINPVVPLYIFAVKQLDIWFNT